jgi:acetate kinase
MRVLALNAGSNSLKFNVVATGPDKGEFGDDLLSGAYDDIGREHSTFMLLDQKRIVHREQVTAPDHGKATELLLDWIDEGRAKPKVNGLQDIERIGHRVVHGADRFDGPVEINDEVVRQIEQLEDLAPLHNASALRVIRAARARTGLQMPMIAVFDTTFHRSIPEEAALYPLPAGLAQRHRIRRYGFHGISHQYLMLRYAATTGRSASEANLVTLHLEGGSSAAAIRQGKSIDTSMGFTPLEGLMMGTRCGDIDPAIVTYLMRKENWAIAETDKFLNKKCGLLGLSGESADTRELITHLENRSAALALDVYSYRVRKYVGAYLAALGGADAIIFGGGIGENTPYVRERVCRGMEWCGAELDRKLNEETIDREGPISKAGSRIQIWVIPTREGLMVARETATYRSPTK